MCTWTDPTQGQTHKLPQNQEPMYRSGNQRAVTVFSETTLEGCSAPEKPHTGHTGATTLCEPAPKFRQVSKLALPMAFRFCLEYCLSAPEPVRKLLVPAMNTLLHTRKDLPLGAL